jgi:hypothetical protein
MTKVDLNPDHCLEALDRTHVVASHFDAHILNHPFITAHPDLEAQSRAIGDALGALYQAIGQTLNDKGTADS